MGNSVQIRFCSDDFDVCAYVYDFFFVVVDLFMKIGEFGFQNK